MVVASSLLGSQPREATLLGRLGQLARGATVVLTVCTGSLLLAATGLLNGLKATTNKARKP